MDNEMEKMIEEEEELIKNKNAEANKTPSIINNNSVTDIDNNTDIAIVEVNKVDELLNKQQGKLLKTDTIIKHANIIASEDIKADLAKAGAEIHKKNIETAETQFETETREQRLKQLKAELTLDHRYKMSIIEANGKHKAMLDMRKKLVEKYSYLYETKNILDKDGNIIGTELVDFSYSKFVNQIRTFTRNISKLDTTIKKLLKWVIIIGGGIAIIAILKAFNIIN